MSLEVCAVRRKSASARLLLVCLTIALLASCGEMSPQQIDRQAEGIAASLAAEYQSRPSATTAPLLIPTPAVEPTVPSLPESAEIVVWVGEVQGSFALDYVQSLCNAYTAEHPGITFAVVQQEPDVLETNFGAAGASGTVPPNLVWTVGNQAAPLAAAGLLAPLDGLVDLGRYDRANLSSLQIDGQTWGVPVSSEGYLLLIYNKALMPTPPQDTADLLALAGQLPEGVYPLTYFQGELYWLVPWLGGFGGRFVAEDGSAPTLDTPEMVAALQFLVELRTAGVVPSESDYAVADTMFRDGQAAAIINGDWSLSQYRSDPALGTHLGVAPIPAVVGGTWPTPYASGHALLVASGLSADKMAVLSDFIAFATTAARQKELVEQLDRMPAVTEVLMDPFITADPIRKGCADQLARTIPLPPDAEQTCIWGAVNPELQAVLDGTTSPEAAAQAMQAAALACWSNP